MALRPDDLPVLSELHVWSIVEWDIFLIMLERRLVARSRDVSPLQKIILHTGIPRYLRSIIIMNLQGYLVDRPSNYELSWQANLDILLDPSMYVNNL